MTMHEMGSEFTADGFLSSGYETDTERAARLHESGIQAATEALAPAFPRNEEHARAWAELVVNAYLNAR